MDMEARVVNLNEESVTLEMYAVLHSFYTSFINTDEQS